MPRYWCAAAQVGAAELKFSDPVVKFNGAWLLFPICLTISALFRGVLPAPADESLQPTSGEAWFVVEFDGQRVGYEQLRWSTSETHPGYLECYRRTEIKLARLARAHPGRSEIPAIRQ